DRATLERGVEAIMRTWVDELAEELARNADPAKARARLRRYRDAFSEGFREVYSPATAVGDIRLIEGLSPSRPLGVDFHRRADEGNAVGLKVWSYNRPIPLSERVPVLENMGFKVVDERTYQIARKGDDALASSPPLVPLASPSPPAGDALAAAADVWLHDMLLQRAGGRSGALPAA